MQRFEIPNHEPSFLPEGEWRLVWADEFDGTSLDRSKWEFRLTYWGEPAKAYTDEGIVLDGKSHIELHRVERDGYYVSPQLQTGSNSFDIPLSNNENPWEGQSNIWRLGVLREPKFVHRFGYYECRCKFQAHPEEMWSAFWMQSPSIGCAYDPAWCGIESDIMECFETGKITSGNIMGGYGAQLREEGRVTYDLPKTADGWHSFGLDWRPNGYDFYCDGVLVSRATADVSQVPQFLLLTTEVQGWRTGAPKKVEGEFRDDAFIVDFVRVFDRIGE